MLEAVYLSGTTRSHRGSRDREMIRFGEEEAHIRIVVEKNEVEHQVDMHLKRNSSKGIAVNRVPIRRGRRFVRDSESGLFFPEDLNLIKDGPSKRRHFLNMELSQLDKIYLDDLTKYHKVLKQRNQLLKDIHFRPDLEETLPVWDDQLIFFGKKIIESRLRFIRELNGIVTDIHCRISGGRNG